MTLTNTCVVLVMDLYTSNYVNGAGMTLGGSWSDYPEPPEVITCH